MQAEIPRCIRPGIVAVTRELLRGLEPADARALGEAIDEMGKRSAKAQGLKKPITSHHQMLGCDNRLFLSVERNAVRGLIRCGGRQLFMRRRADSDYVQVNPLSVLDFYVCESLQRSGEGKRLFEHMCQHEATCAAALGYDRPSSKFIGFLRKHYGLKSYTPQSNHFLLFDDYWSRSHDSDPHERSRQRQPNRENDPPLALPPPPPAELPSAPPAASLLGGFRRPQPNWQAPPMAAVDLPVHAAPIPGTAGQTATYPPPQAPSARSLPQPPVLPPPPPSEPAHVQQPHLERPFASSQHLQPPARTPSQSYSRSGAFPGAATMPSSRSPSGPLARAYHDTGDFVGRSVSRLRDQVAVAAVAHQENRGPQHQRSVPTACKRHTDRVPSHAAPTYGLQCSFNPMPMQHQMSRLLSRPY